MIKLGIVMDPISKINISKDSSFAMLLAAQAKGWQLYYMEPQDLYVAQGIAKAKTYQLTVQRDNNNWYQLSEAADLELASLDVILMRKDPPFDMDFIALTYILELAERCGTLVVNKPQSLRDCNEKMFINWFPECTTPTVVSCDAAVIKRFWHEHQDIILKPLNGMGGAAIFRVKPGDANFNVILEMLTREGKEHIMAQRFIPEIKAGDKRILLIDGEPIPYSLARIPAEGENRGNLAAGGSGVAQAISERDRWICQQIAPVLQDKGLLFVGIDVIGDYVTEINVTSPTCIQELDKAFNLDIAGDLMNCIEHKLSQK